MVEREDATYQVERLQAFLIIIYSIIYSIECMVSFLREDERDAASYGFPSVKHGLFTHKQLLLK